MNADEPRSSPETPPSTGAGTRFSPRLVLSAKQAPHHAPSVPIRAVTLADVLFWLVLGVSMTGCSRSNSLKPADAAIQHEDSAIDHAAEVHNRSDVGNEDTSSEDHDSSLPDALSADATTDTDSTDTNPDSNLLSCSLQSNGTCVPTTPDTSCTPFPARIFDDVANCTSAQSKVVACCAASAGAACAAPAIVGCLTSADTDGGREIWFVSSLWTASGFEQCDGALGAKVTGAPVCQAD